jgi:hypothetical protein
LLDLGVGSLCTSLFPVGEAVFFTSGVDWFGRRGRNL